MIFLLFGVGSAPAAPVTTVSWDTSDPVFYKHWQRIHDRERARHQRADRQELDELEQPAAAEAPTTKSDTARPPSPQLIAALAGVRSIDDLEKLRPLDVATIDRLIAEASRAIAQQLADDDDDDLENLLMVTLA